MSRRSGTQGAFKPTRYWEKLADAGKVDPILALHGRVRRICIGCKTAEIGEAHPTKLCNPCFEATPDQECECGKTFKAPYKRRHCGDCLEEIRDSRRTEGGRKPPMQFD